MREWATPARDAATTSPLFIRTPNIGACKAESPDFAHIFSFSFQILCGAAQDESHNGYYHLINLWNKLLVTSPVLYCNSGKIILVLFIVY